MIGMSVGTLNPLHVTQRVVATLPPGTDANDLAVYVPEPGSGLGEFAATLALIALARRVR